jgi:hypothetical protein
MSNGARRTLGFVLFADIDHRFETLHDFGRGSYQAEGEWASAPPYLVPPLARRQPCGQPKVLEDAVYGRRRQDRHDYLQFAARAWI